MFTNCLVIFYLFLFSALVYARSVLKNYACTRKHSGRPALECVHGQAQLDAKSPAGKKNKHHEEFPDHDIGLQPDPQLFLDRFS